MIRGSCLCGAVSFELRGRVSPIQTCHCSRCRKASGSAFGAALMCAARNFVWLSGQDHIATYRLPTGFASAFCKTCGSPTPTPTLEGKTKSFPAGCLDDDPGTRLYWHTFVGSKAPWFEITDDLPQHVESPRQRDG
ncbi:MAG: GFA family protein [Myxococcota bacterium]